TNQFESSFFGDPTYGDNSPNNTAANGLQTATTNTNDKLQYGTRNFVVRYNGAFSPTWLANASFSWGHNNLSDKPFSPGTYDLVAYSQRNTCNTAPIDADCTDPSNILRGQNIRQGLGYFENTTGDNYGLNLDTSKSFRFLGEHNVTFGYSFARSHYNG